MESQQNAGSGDRTLKARRRKREAMTSINANNIANANNMSVKGLRHLKPAALIALKSGLGLAVAGSGILPAAAAFADELAGNVVEADAPSADDVDRAFESAQADLENARRGYESAQADLASKQDAVAEARRAVEEASKALAAAEAERDEAIASAPTGDELDAFALEADEAASRLAAAEERLRGATERSEQAEQALAEAEAGARAAEAAYDRADADMRAAVAALEQAERDAQAAADELERISALDDGQIEAEALAVLAGAEAEKARAEAELAEAREAESIAKGELDAARSAEAESNARLERALSDESEAEASLEEERARKAALDASLADARAELKAAIEARVSADRALNAAQTRLDEAASAEASAVRAEQDAQANLAEAEAAAEAARIVAENAQAELASGLYGFLEHIGCAEGVAALDSSRYASLTARGDAKDATSLKSLQSASAYIRECNALRAAHGLEPLKVSPLLIAYAAADANYSDTELEHAQQFRMNGENVAWNYGSDPFRQWYDEEKADYEATGNAFEAGHYLNIIEPRFTTTGFATCLRGTMRGWRTYAQTFGSGAGFEEGAMTVGEFEAAVDEWVSSLEDAPARYAAALEAVSSARAAAGIATQAATELPPR